ncbi:hypothetical protein L486_06640 [Kwoniella mangroviensis CBS 10435]|uniref:Uncharacterized protein n=1 Tax=Kwoniella mangroviensis CBS 10435 TaxID=1331196 RepID=A0A1B9IKI8_9TREE|nr:hypothetical protein L486_06640 [Kwoniella mangroviensis CBS 10435]
MLRNIKLLPICKTITEFTKLDIRPHDLPQIRLKAVTDLQRLEPSEDDERKDHQYIAELSGHRPVWNSARPWTAYRSSHDDRGKGGPFGWETEEQRRRPDIKEYYINAAIRQSRSTYPWTDQQLGFTGDLGDDDREKGSTDPPPPPAGDEKVGPSNTRDMELTTVTTDPTLYRAKICSGASSPISNYTLSENTARSFRDALEWQNSDVDIRLSEGIPLEEKKELRTGWAEIDTTNGNKSPAYLCKGGLSEEQLNMLRSIALLDVHYSSDVHTYFPAADK